MKYSKKSNSVKLKCSSCISKEDKIFLATPGGRKIDLPVKMVDEDTPERVQAIDAVIEESPVTEAAPITEAASVTEAVTEAKEAPEAETLSEAEETAIEEEAPAVVVAKEAPTNDAEIAESSSAEDANEAKADTPKPKRKKFKLSLTTKKTLSGWLFVLPFVIGILFIYLPIIVDSLKYSFANNDSITILKFEYVGFQNYIDIFTKDPWYSITFVDGLKDLILQIPAIVIFALFMAIILNQKMTGRAAFRAIFFLPVVLSTGIIDKLDSRSTLLDSMENTQGAVDDNTGEEAGGIVSALDISMLLSNIKLGSGLVEIVTNLVNNIFDVVSRSGVQMLIFLSGLQSISPAIYESCQMEGATPWETFWKITLPMISPMILVNGVYTVIDLFTAADNNVMYYVSKEIFGKASNYAWASAMYWVYVGVVLLFIVIIALILKSVVFYQRRD